MSESIYNLPNQLPEYYKLLEAYEDALREAKYWERNYLRVSESGRNLLKQVSGKGAMIPKESGD